MTTADIARTAEAVLDALLDEQPLPELPSVETSEWAEAFLAAFRRFRDGQRGREARDAAERLGRTAAANPYRFFWEFWQNADDAGATELQFVIEPDRLVISNNGPPFTTLEVFSLLTVGRSTKYGDDRTMGQWGVGSLSLMRFSDRPLYGSGPWRFALERSYTYPGVEPGASPSEEAGLSVVAQLSPDVDAEELADGLKGLLSEEALLYMQHLERVTVTGPDGEEHVLSAQVERQGPASRVALGDEVWLRFEEELVPPSELLRDGGRPAPESVHVVLARRARAATSPSQVYVFFPTQVTHHYPWRFSAPLDVTTGREGLIDSRFNRWLLKAVGRAMVRASVNELAGSRSAPWSLVPRGAEKDRQLAEVWTGALEEMQTAAWLPAGRRRLRAGQVAFASTETVRELVRPADITSLSGGERVWVAGTPPPQVHEALVAAGAMRVGPVEVATTLSTAAKGRGPAWFLRAACAIVDGDPTPRAVQLLSSGKCFLTSRGTPFSLEAASREGKVVCNTRSEVLSAELGDLFARNLVVPLHRMYRVPDKKSDSELDLLRRRLDEWLRETSADATFTYESRFDAAAFIKLFVIERDAASEGGAIADRLLSFVRDHLEAYVSEEGRGNRERAFQQLGRALRIRAFRWGPNGRPVHEYRSLSEVHLAAAYLERRWWPDAARGVAGLWWADSRYRKLLVRGPDNPLSVNGFLLRLGLEDGPRLVEAPLDGWHGTYQFSKVTHGDQARYPNYPHSRAKFYQYSAFGFAKEVVSAELDAVLDFITKLPAAERKWRGECLVRMFEEQWESRFAQRSTTAAMAYRANGGYLLDGAAIARWLWNVRTTDWVERAHQGPGKPVDTYARTAASSVLVNPRVDPISEWACRDTAVADALGFKTQVPAGVVVDYLRQAKERGAGLTAAQARAYYGHLARLGPDAREAWRSLTEESLIYCGERSTPQWRTSTACLQQDARATFGNCVGYLVGDIYGEARALWDALGVRERADFEFIVRTWARLSEETEPSARELRQVLPATYAAAEGLLDGHSPLLEADVISESGWIRSTAAFVTRSSELAQQLRERGLELWDNPYYELHPRLVRVLGVLDADRGGEVAVIDAKTVDRSSDDESRIHGGVAAFAAEVHAAQQELWQVLEKRLREAVEGRVSRLRPLRLRITLRHRTFGKAAFEVGEAAFYRAGGLYLSELTQPSDPAVAAAILSGLPLTGEQRWAVSGVLQLHLGRENPGAGAVFPVAPEFEEPDLEDDPFYPFEEQPEPAKGTGRPKPKRDAKPAEPPHPLDDYHVEADTGAPGVDDEAKGGLEPRGSAELRKPVHGGGGGGGGGGGNATSPSWTSTEQRGIDLYRKYVLDPQGVEVRDQRIRPGVGADLVGSDGVYRELKTFSGAGPATLPLTEHEYRRAGNQGDRYELVVVEHVRGDAIVTVVADPLRRLRYTPTGGVIVKEWRGKSARARVVTLRRGKPADNASKLPSGTG